MTTNANDATTINQLAEEATTASITPSTGAAFGGSAATTTATATKPRKDQKKPSHPKLLGKYLFIKPIVESQRAILARTMFDHCKDMLNTETTRRLKVEICTKFASHFHDEDDNGIEKPYIPNSLRLKMPINISKKIKNDSRCAARLSAITNTMERADVIHEKYKSEMAVFARTIAHQELKARCDILRSQYSACALGIAEGLVKVGKWKNKSPPPKITDVQISHCAIHDAFQKLPADHWEKLAFVDISSGDTTAAIEAFYKQFQDFAKINYDADIREHIDNADAPLIEWISLELQQIIPHLTTKFWEHESNIDEEKKLDAELNEIYVVKKIISANADLADGMEIESEDALDGIIQKKVDRAYNKSITKKKNAARKNSSADAKTQASTATENGQKSASKSKKQREKEPKKSGKRQDHPYYDDDDDSHYRSMSRPRYYDQDRDHYHHDRDRHDYYHDRRGRDSHRPHSILKRRSVSWGRPRSPNPPRTRYSRDETPQRHRGSTYHPSTRDPDPPTGRGNRQGRGGRGGRGGSNRGGRGRGGRQS